MSKKTKKELFQRRRWRARKKISGTIDRPRMNIYKSLTNLYVQLIDDNAGHTLASVSTYDTKIGGSANVETGLKLGKLIAEKAKEAKISQVVFDKSGYKYHGVIKAVVQTARDEGLKI
ncbi:MAG: 50S ribosomal protein L18 [Verrucomicrobiota bacterium]|nr:50S ribosomal protein L18 [Verrucomicrobiota bacterium]